MSLAAEPDVVPAYAEWRRGVAGVLAKMRKVDPAELPDEPESLLTEQTYDGVEVAPLYTRRDERAELPLPGRFPFVRGRDGRRDVQRGWHVNSCFGGSGQPADVNRAILAGLGTGTSAVRLGVGARGVAAADLPEVLAGLLFELAPVALDAGADAAEAATQLYEVLDAYVCPDRAAIVASLGAGPLTSRFSGTADVNLEAAVALAESASTRAETIRAITVDGTVFHDAGAADAQELGAAAAAGLAYLRALTGAGLPVEVALSQLEFRFAATDDQFQAIAKFRAARQLWARVAQVCGAPGAGDAPQHAVTSAAMLTQRDPWVNLLRGTLAAFGAGVGGADTVTVRRFDSALPPGALGVSAAFAERMARNTQLLLLEESHLGRVLDPAAGSWYVEDLTAAIAARAWEFMQQIETAGGYLAAVASGELAERIGATKARRDTDVAHRRTTVTGVNEFPNLAERSPDLTESSEFDPGRPRVARYGAAFERLRDRSDSFLAATGRRPRVLLVPLGPVAEHNARRTFAANLLASGGIEAVDPGTVTASTVGDAVAAAGVTIALLCGSDKRYGTDAADVVVALRAAGVETVLLAGPQRAVAESTGAARPDGFLTARIDAVSALGGLLDKMGA